MKEKWFQNLKIADCYHSTSERVVLQTGHVIFFLNHNSMQSAWKQCSHLAMLLIISWKLYPSRHVGQMQEEESGPEFVLLSLITTNDVQVLILESSNPSWCGGAVVAVAVSGWISGAFISSLLPLRLNRNSKQIVNTMPITTADGMKIGDPTYAPKNLLESSVN